MKKVLGRIWSFIKWLNAWCIGHIFYKGKYLHGKYFQRFSYSIGWRWLMHDVFMQKIVGINRGVPFPVNFNVTVTNWKRIEFDRDNITIFQKPGNYYQASGGAKIVVGKDSYIACNVGIVTANHDLNDLTRHSDGKDVVIGERSWIGLNSVILPGVVLGPHTIVGAGSVVTKSFPQGNCVIAGNPAKVIKMLDGVNEPNVGSKDCTGCMLCVRKCPAGAISIKEENGFPNPSVDASKCVKCGLCNKICPVNEPRAEKDPERVIALCDKDEEKRAAASSGGAVGLMADAFFRAGGAVSGVVYDENMLPVHRVAHTPEEFAPMRGSKYVQSLTDTVFDDLEEELKTGKPVLATGVPCQIAAIKAYFGGKYDNLYTCDLICHGVQSPQIFREYVASLEKKYGAKVVDLKFRDKTHGWKKSNVKVRLADGREIVMTRDECDYFKYFNYLRRSCYNCRFRGFNNRSDVTVGDYWGIESLTDRFSDDRGVSILLCHTQKGNELISMIGDRAIIEESDLGHALATHKKLKSSISVPPPRNEFFRIMGSDGYEKAVRFYKKKTRLFNFKRKIKRLFKK